MNVGQILETHLGWAAKGPGGEDQRPLEKALQCRSIKKGTEAGVSSPECNRFFWMGPQKRKSKSLSAS